MSADVKSYNLPAAFNAAAFPAAATVQSLCLLVGEIPGNLMIGVCAGLLTYLTMKNFAAGLKTNQGEQKDTSRPAGTQGPTPE